MQLSALNALLKTVNPDVLAVPKNKLKLFNPRSSINSRDRESFTSNLGEEFDPISVAANTSRLSFDLMLDPSRLSRISLIESIQGDSFTLENMLKKLLIIFLIINLLIVIKLKFQHQLKMNLLNLYLIHFTQKNCQYHLK